MTLDQIIKRGLELGLEAVEVYASTTESNSLKLDEGKLESYSMKELFNVSIRGLKNGKMASVTTESLDDEIVEQLLQALARNVDALDALEPEFMFEGGSTYQPVEELNANYKNYTVAQKVELLKKLEKGCQGLFFDGFRPIGENPNKGKSGVLMGTHITRLCKRNVHNTPQRGCGKPLWRSLWKMWKSSGFPQQNRKKPYTAPWKSGA